jgi:hypothetical protein
VGSTSVIASFLAFGSLRKLLLKILQELGRGNFKCLQLISLQAVAREERGRAESNGYSHNIAHAAFPALFEIE